MNFDQFKKCSCDLKNLIKNVCPILKFEKKSEIPIPLLGYPFEFRVKKTPAVFFIEWPNQCCRQGIWANKVAN